MTLPGEAVFQTVNLRLRHLRGYNKLSLRLFRGMGSLFIGFETLNSNNLREHHKLHNLNRDYDRAIRRLHDLGVMINGSFVFGMDHDDETVFDRTTAWAVEQGIETATFHILTPYPGTALYERMSAAGRITSQDWNLYDTRHVVYQPANMTPEVLQSGYWRAYGEFYRWRAIFKGAGTKTSTGAMLRHLAYAGGWKKFEPLWDLVIRAGQISRFLPLLEMILGNRQTADTHSHIKEIFPESVDFHQGLKEGGEP